MVLFVFDSQLLRDRWRIRWDGFELEQDAVRRLARFRSDMTLAATEEIPLLG
jgi:hypothetical protein